MDENKNILEKLKKHYFALLIIVGILTLSIIFQTASRIISPNVSQTSKQEIVTVGDEISANFKIYNPSGDPQLYSYAVYLDDEKKYESTVTIQPQRNFVFGGHYRAIDPGVVKVSALVYEGEKERLIENISYYVTVRPKE